MTTISASVHRAKETKICDSCRELIKTGRRYLRLFGFAHSSDPPYEMTVHLTCMNDMHPDKCILEALKEAKIEFVVSDPGRYGHVTNIVDPEFR